MRAATRFLLLCWTAALACSSFHCASQQAPGGGPRDLAAPAILESTPPQHAVNFRGRVIELDFDKYVDHRTVQDAFFISPAVLTRPEFSWSGRSVTITFHDSLRANTTYTVSLGTDIADVRENVHLASPYTLSFSTGPVIDSATISGRVYSENNTGVFVFAYRLNDRSADTLNPTHTPPDYLAPVGKDSTYIIPALPRGTYRLIAIRDEQRNLLYDVGADAFCAGTTDVRIDSAHNAVQRITFRIAPPEDTIAPELTFADAATTTYVRADFSEPLDSSTLDAARFSLRDSLTGAPLLIRSAVPSAKRTRIDLYTDAMTPARVYILTADSLRDRAGNMMRPARMAFAAVATPDTVAPVVTWPFADSVRDISDPKWVFTFSEPLQRKLAESAITLSDSLRSSIPLRYRWPNDATLAIYDDRQHDNQWYTLTVNVQYFADFANNHTRDSVRKFHFRTRDVRTLGTLKGAIVDLTNKTHAGYYVTATNVDTKRTYTNRVGEMGPFTLDDLPDGTYAIEAFRDDNGDGVITPGRVFPFRHGEPYTALPGTMRVRARWTIEGLRLVF